jgi:mannose-6-phosphate isomerase-like protein (cupin superfamily)
MQKTELKDFIGGWFIGDFVPSLLPNSDFEVAVKYYKAGDIEASHVHKIAKEFTVIVEGEVKMNSQIYKSGDIVQVEPGEYTDFGALTKTITIVVKTPSVKNDKYLL